jgi:hypothetical protein
MDSQMINIIIAVLLTLTNIAVCIAFIVIQEKINKKFIKDWIEKTKIQDEEYLKLLKK